jgi:hypothetical protein
MTTFRQIALRYSPKRFLDLYFEKRAKSEHQKWIKEGKPIPPPHAVKKYAIREYQKK